MHNSIAHIVPFATWGPVSEPRTAESTTRSVLVCAAALEFDAQYEDDEDLEETKELQQLIVKDDFTNHARALRDHFVER